LLIGHESGSEDPVVERAYDAQAEGIGRLLDE
jgi:hypothetical protein